MGGGLFFSWGASFVSGGASHGRSWVFMEGFSKKSWDGGEGGGASHAPPLGETRDKFCEFER